MGTLNQNNVTFALNADTATPFGGKYTNDQNFDDNTGKYNVNQNKLNNIGVYKSFNAVEIDWNDANLASRKSEIENAGVPDSQSLPSALKTTGELLDIIATQQAQIDALILMVKGIYAGLAQN